MMKKQAMIQREGEHLGDQIRVIPLLVMVISSLNSHNYLVLSSSRSAANEPDKKENLIHSSKGVIHSFGLPVVDFPLTHNTFTEKKYDEDYSEFDVSELSLDEITDSTFNLVLNDDDKTRTQSSSSFLDSFSEDSSSDLPLLQQGEWKLSPFLHLSSLRFFLFCLHLMWFTRHIISWSSLTLARSTCQGLWLSHTSLSLITHNRTYTSFLQIWPEQTNLKGLPKSGSKVSNKSTNCPYDFLLWWLSHIRDIQNSLPIMYFDKLMAHGHRFWMKNGKIFWRFQGKGWLHLFPMLSWWLGVMIPHPPLQKWFSSLVVSST